jgi:Protein of unknown function (DUF4058)
MPLLDHFHPPLHPRRHWESFHTAWAGTIADVLNRDLLPEGYFAEEQTHAGARVEIDVATFQDAGTEAERLPGPGVTATLPPRLWTPCVPCATISMVFPSDFEVLVFQSEGGNTLIAAIELISPSNKDRPVERRAFATKCANYLYRGVSLIVVDIVTSRQANLHHDILALLENAAVAQLPSATHLYAVAYRPIQRGQAAQADIWTAAVAVGQPLPLLPLALDAQCCLPIDLEATYEATCERRRIT